MRSNNQSDTAKAGLTISISRPMRIESVVPVECFHQMSVRVGQRALWWIPRSTALKISVVTSWSSGGYKMLVFPLLLGLVCFFGQLSVGAYFSVFNSVKERSSQNQKMIHSKRELDPRNQSRREVHPPKLLCLAQQRRHWARKQLQHPRS